MTEIQTLISYIYIYNVLQIELNSYDELAYFISLKSKILFMIATKTNKVKSSIYTKNEIKSSVLITHTHTCTFNPNVVPHHHLPPPHHVLVDLQEKSS
jgi:hypothetical protein